MAPFPPQRSWKLVNKRFLKTVWLLIVLAFNGKRKNIESTNRCGLRQLLRHDSEGKDLCWEDKFLMRIALNERVVNISVDTEVRYNAVGV